MLKLIKRGLIILLTLIGLLVIAYLVFTNYSTSFGGDISKEKQK